MSYCSAVQPKRANKPRSGSLAQVDRFHEARRTLFLRLVTDAGCRRKDGHFVDHSFQGRQIQHRYERRPGARNNDINAIQSHVGEPVTTTDYFIYLLTYLYKEILIITLISIVIQQMVLQLLEASWTEQL